MSLDSPSELSRLRTRTPEPRAGLADAVMRQVALRQKPRRSWWVAFTQSRTLVMHFRWSRATALAGAAALFAGLMGLNARRSPTGRIPFQIPAPVVAGAPAESRPVLIRFALPQAAAAGAREVSLAGDFNGWRASATPLERNADGTWTAVVPLPQGTWTYSFVVDGKFVEDPFAGSYRADGFGGRNALVRVGG